MADDVQFTVAANATPPGGTFAATDETASGPHSVGSHMGIAKLAVAADGDSTHIPATAADGLLVNVSNASLTGPTSSTLLSVDDDAADVELLAANALRLGFSVTNDSSATLYLALAGAVSLTSYTVRIPTFGFFSDDSGYIGAIHGIWDSDPNDGAARITELEV